MGGSRTTALIAAGWLLAGCATQPSADTVNLDHPEREGVPGAVEAPFHDANLVRTKIPDVLRLATLAPYARPTPASCMQIASDVQDLDDVLGDDLDIPIPPDPSLAAKRGRQTGELMVTAMRDAEADFIPFRGWVRLLDGAELHDKHVRAAVYAGRVRRAYLKGLGEAIGCRFPAEPKGASPLPVRPELTPAAGPPPPGRPKNGPQRSPPASRP
jgi:hypothetical protein